MLGYLLEPLLLRTAPQAAAWETFFQLLEGSPARLIGLSPRRKFVYLMSWKPLPFTTSSRSAANFGPSLGRGNCSLEFTFSWMWSRLPCSEAYTSFSLVTLLEQRALWTCHACCQGNYCSQLGKSCF